MRPKVIAIVCAAIIVVQVMFSFGAVPWLTRSRLFGVIEASALTDGTNVARTANNLPALTENPLLQAAAQEKANDMATKGYFAHTSPTGITPWHWLTDVGYSFVYAGENLAVNFSDSQDVTTAWLNSPEHRANILDVNFTQIGIATAQGFYDGRPATYVVEFFGTPAVAVASIAQTGPSSQKGGQKAIAVARTIVVKRVSPPPVVAINPVTGTEPIAVAVKGAEISAGQLMDSSGRNAVQVSAGVLTSAIPAVTPAVNRDQTNIVQRAIANPAQTLNNVYFLVIAFFLFALGLNVFIEIRVQHPDLILSGLAVVSLAGIFIIANQQAILKTIIK